MAEISSTPSQPISVSSPRSAATMSSSNFQPVDQQLKTPESETLAVQDSKTKETDSEKLIENRDEDEEGEEEEEGECGFCLFMKGGGCKETFIEWEKCVEESEKKNEDVVEKCFQATTSLKKCMEAHSDYYSPILQAEKVAQAEAGRRLEEEKERSNKGGAGEELGKKENEVTLGASDPKK